MNCLNCLSSLVVNKRGRPKKFCNIKCKDAYAWKIEKEFRPAEKVKTCLTCGSQFPTRFASRAQYCSQSCQPYQVAFKAKEVFHPCKGCQTNVFVRRVYCNPCWELVNSTINAPKTRHSEKTRRDRRLKREFQAPGLTTHNRQKLLTQWKTERQPCSYCFNLADTIDHIVPLTRGGTHFEENLFPCCRACNSSKANKLISEWKVLDVSAKAK
jgi:5-methylcytosine-specific restriction endonuclease McrA